MKTKKQEELVNTFLSELSEDIRPLYQRMILHLSQAGYTPHKQRSFIVFKHDLHNKQMAKIGIKKNVPFFALRFSACHGYPQKFADIVCAAIEKPSFREAKCVQGACSYCNGEVTQRVYTHTFPNGAQKYHCGAVALEIPDITSSDVEDVKQLIVEEHDFLIKHEVNV